MPFALSVEAFLPEIAVPAFQHDFEQGALFLDGKRGRGNFGKREGERWRA